ARRTETFAAPRSCVALRHPGFIERGHLRENLDRGKHQTHAKTGAGAFPQPKIEIEQRFQPKMIQYRLMPSFDRPMRGNEIVFASRLQTYGNQCGCPGDEPVQYDRNTSRRGTKHQPCQPADFKPSYGGEYLQCICRIKPMEIKRSLNYVDLACMTGVV